MEKIIVGHRDAYVTGKFDGELDIKSAYHFDSFDEAKRFIEENSVCDISEFHFRIIEIETITDRIFKGIEAMKKDGKKVVAVYLGKKEYKELSDQRPIQFNKFIGIDIFEVSENNHFNIIDIFECQ